jgi:hypothetical protein
MKRPDVVIMRHGIAEGRGRKSLNLPHERKDCGIAAMAENLTLCRHAAKRGFAAG